MMNKQEYDDFLKGVSARLQKLSNYSNYQKFENDWKYYLENIYEKNSDSKKPPRIFLAESAPDGIYDANTNYIFLRKTLGNKICPTKDMYLWRYYKGVFYQKKSEDVKKLSKEDILIQLSEKNILIMDLLPTHGIKLNTKERVKIKTHLLKSLNFTTLEKFSYPNQKINYAYSIPPSLHGFGMCANILTNQSFQEFDNVNSGQGHAPSIKAIREIILKGF